MTVTDDLRDLALARRDRRERIALAAKLAAARLWRRLDKRNLTASWDSGIGRGVVTLVTTAQLEAARGAETYVDKALSIQGIADPDPDGRLIPEALAGIASDGRPLSSLLYRPIVGVKTSLSGDVALREAMDMGLRNLQLMIDTQVIDAGRVADGVGTVSRRKSQGYVRVLSPPSCARCAILAGRIYGSERPFERHPRCLPVGTVVSGPAPVAATRRWFEGELVIIRTASGQKLSITGNHPVLTDRGWVPAHLVQEGDHALRSLLSQGATPLVVPDERQMPTLIEDVGRPGAMAGLVRVPTSAEDFHGDGGYGEVDIVFSDGLLRDYGAAALQKPGVHQHLAARNLLSGVLAGQGSSGQDFSVVGGRADSGSCLGELGLAPFRDFFCGTDETGFRAAPDGYARSFEMPSDHGTRDVVALAERELAFSGEVSSRDLGFGQDDDLARWDAPALPFTAEGRGAYLQLGKSLQQRLAGQVELDRIVEVSRVDFAGHVYNLSTSEGWYAADSLIVSNCDCQHLATGDKDTARSLTLNVKDYFAGLPKSEQDRIFTKAGAEAIRLGADINQVVNARRGMSTASVFGRELLTTTEGTTRRGFAHTRMGGAPVRLMPEAVMQIAKDRDEVLRLLRRYGYLS